MQPAEDLLDLLKMLPAMLGAKHVERAARRFVSHEEVVGQRRHLAIGRRGDPDGKLGGPARSQGEQKRLLSPERPADLSPRLLVATGEVGRRG